jgi:hypothetical protein
MTDPRNFPDTAAAPAECARLHGAAQASLAAETGLAAAACDRVIADALDAWLTPGNGPHLSALLASAPSAAVHRHLWRILAERERAGAPDPAQLLRLFAIPVVVVAGIERTAREAVVLPGVVADVGPLEALLREHRALAGHQTFTLGNALAAADELEPARLPELLHWRTLAEAPEVRAVAPAPLTVTGGIEGVFLRFLVGTVLAAPGADPLRDAAVGAWGIPFARSLGQSLAVPGISLLALPRAPQPLTTALWQGRLAQREVGAQLFASNAIRKLRAATGEPSAVISVHRMDAPAGGGEVRLSLSSPFDPREAEGFRYPLLPLDRVEDVVQMLTTLMADCRIADVRVLSGVHADRDRATGLTLLFKAADLPPATAVH